MIEVFPIDAGSKIFMDFPFKAIAIALKCPRRADICKEKFEFC